jgi:hypothetical protein
LIENDSKKAGFGRRWRFCEAYADFTQVKKISVNQRHRPQVGHLRPKKICQSERKSVIPTALGATQSYGGFLNTKRGGATEVI